MEKIYIVGAGGFAREVAWLIEDINEKKLTWEIAGFIDDNLENLGKELNGYKVLGDIDYLNNQEKSSVVIAIGNSQVRERIANKIKKHDFPTIIHPEAKISNLTKIGEGSIICYGNTISVNTELGKFNILNIGSTIGHDTILSDFVSVMSNVTISGNVTIGKHSMIGSGSVILQGKTVGENSIVGIGSAVVKKVKSNNTAMGVPAKNYSNI